MEEYYLLNTRSQETFRNFLCAQDWEDAQAGILQVVGAVEDNLAVGALVFEPVGNVAFLRTVSVADVYQGKGIAGGLLHYLKEILPALDCYTIIASLVETVDGHKAIEGILQRSGFVHEMGPDIISCPLEILLASPYVQQISQKMPNNILQLVNVPDISLKEFNIKLHQIGVLDKPLNWKRFDAELTYCGVQNGEITCCLCASRTAEGVCVEWMYLQQGAELTMMGVIATTLQASLKACGHTARFSAVLLNDASKALAEKLLKADLQKIVYTKADRYALEL